MKTRHFSLKKSLTPMCNAIFSHHLLLRLKGMYLIIIKGELSIVPQLHVCVMISESVMISVLV